MLQFINDSLILFALFGSDDPFSSAGNGDFRSYPGDYETIGIPFTFSGVIFWIVIGFIILFLLGVLINFIRFIGPKYDECNKNAHTTLAKGKHALTLYTSALTAMQNKENIHKQIRDNIQPLLSIFRPGGVQNVNGGSDRPCVAIPQQQPERITEVANKVIDSIMVSPEISLKDCTNQKNEFNTSMELFGESRHKWGYWPFSYLFHIVQIIKIHYLSKRVDQECITYDKQIRELNMIAVKGINEAIDIENKKILSSNNETQQTNKETSSSKDNVDANKLPVNDNKSEGASQDEVKPAGPKIFRIKPNKN